QPGAHVWETAFSVEAFPYLADHRLGTLVVLPAAAYAELALAAGTQAFGHQPFRLDDLTFQKMLIIDESSESSPTTIQVSLSQDNAGAAHVQVASRRDSEDTWTMNAAGIIRLLESSE